MTYIDPVWRLDINTDSQPAPTKITWSLVLNRKGLSKFHLQAITYQKSDKR